MWALFKGGCLIFLTAIAGFIFQYIGWHNTAVLQEANELVGRASSAYEKAANLVGKRRYASFRYTYAIEDLYEKNLNDSNALSAKLGIDLNKQRFISYFDQLKDWSERYDQIIGEIDFSLDRPVGIQENIHNRVIAKFNCREPFIKELKRLGLNYRSLKMQFAAINFCFRLFREEAEELTNLILSENDIKALDISKLEKVKTDLRERKLSDILTHTNIFRCYALNRVDFLRTIRVALIDRSIWDGLIGSFSVFQSAPEQNVFIRYAKEAAKTHFLDTQSVCGQSILPKEAPKTPS